MSMSHFSKVSSTVTLGFLGGSFLRKLVDGNKFESEKLRQIRNLELGILGIASGQYAITLPMQSNKRIQRWRYADWIVTTPMLLKTFHLLAQEKGYQGGFELAFGANIVMIIAGYFAEFHPFNRDSKNGSIFWYVLGFVALIFVLIEVAKWDKHLKDNNVDTRNLPTFFYLGWVLYGLTSLNHYVTQDIRQTAFAVLDLFNKGIYSLELESVIKNYF